MPTETPAQYRARVASNAAKSNSPVPPINRAPIPSPAQPALNIPRPVNVPLPSRDPGLARRGK
jgi:hypothetical protein